MVRSKAKIPETSIGDEEDSVVVQLFIKGKSIVTEYDVYIDGPVSKGTIKMTGSRWANPFRKGEPTKSSQDEYEQYLIKRLDLLQSLETLKGKRLGCWCTSIYCHGHILLKYIDLVTEKPDIVMKSPSLQAPLQALSFQALSFQTPCHVPSLPPQALPLQTPSCIPSLPLQISNAAQDAGRYISPSGEVRVLWGGTYYIFKVSLIKDISNEFYIKDLEEKNYRIIRKDGKWKVCGYEDAVLVNYVFPNS